MALACALSAGSCALSSHVDSHYVQGERVELRPLETTDKGFLPIGPLAAALAPSVINFTTAKLEEVYARRSEDYVASYSATRVGEDFYRSDTSLEFSFGALEVNRYVGEKASGKEVPASVLRLQWVANGEHSLFALIPERVQVRKAKARLRAGDKDLDLSIQVTLQGYWQQKNGEVKSKLLGDAGMVLKNIRLGETYTLAGEGGQFWLEDANGNKSNYNLQTSWMAPVPVSVSEQGNRLENARGNYVLTVTITETDDYGERVARFGRDLHDARGVLTELLEKLGE